jgi:RNA recognition motif-containing protein
MRDRDHRRVARRVSRSRSPERRRSRSRDRGYRRNDRSSPPRRPLRRESPPRRRQEEPVAPPMSKYSEHPGSSTVWIGSIPEGITEDDLFESFSKFGRIEGYKIVNSRGFGYVRFSHEGEANDALKSFASHPLTMGGKRCRIDLCEHMNQLTHPYRPSKESSPPGCTTLFVGNLEMEISEEELGKFFEPLVVVSVSLRRGGYKGMAFAHVRFESPEACQRAANEFAGKRVRNNRIRLDWALEKLATTDTPSSAVGGPKTTEALRGTTPRVYVGGLNDMMIEEDMKSAFAPFGNIAAVKLHKDKSGSRSFGYVTFETAQAAEKAVDNPTRVSVKGQRVRVDFARPDRGAGLPPVHRTRSPSPQQPRVTPVSYHVPDGYGVMKSWEQCYGH